MLENIEIPISKENLEQLIADENSEWWNSCPIYQENVYSCAECKQYIVTQDIDRGITPPYVPCKYPPCTGDMVSHNYPPMDIKPDIVPDASWEWYRPDVIEGNSEEVRHLVNGGLMLRKMSDVDEKH